MEILVATRNQGKVREIRFIVGPVPGDEEGGPPREEAGPPEGYPVDAGPQPGPEGIENVADPELRGILASLSRKAASRKP